MVVYKEEGEDTSVEQVEKPKITPIDSDREERSDFFKKVTANEPEPIEPQFLNFEEDITKFTIGDNLPAHYVKNEENDLFRMYYLLDMGREHDLKTALAVRYLEFLGTDEYTPEEINKEFYNLAGRFGISTGSDQSYVYVRGLESEFEETMELFHHLLANAEHNEEALENLIDDIMRERENNKQEQSTILHRAMRSYATYGKDNPFNHRLSEEELREVDAEELVSKLHDLLEFEHKVLYYGPSSPEMVQEATPNFHPMHDEYKPYPEKKTFERRSMDEDKVYFADYDMVQAEILWLNKSVQFDPELIPVARLFNRYFGVGMSSIVFQQLRESQALAYSTRSWFTTPSKKEDPHYILSYIGTQHDKLEEAVSSMNELKTNLPENRSRFQDGRETLLNNLRTSRTTRQSILFAYDDARKRGLDYDLNEKVYNDAQDLTLDHVMEFHDKHYSDRNYYYLVLGDEEKVDQDVLRDIGELEVLELEEIFGY